MTYAITNDNGSILGSFHSTKEAAISDAKAFARQSRTILRVIGYGRAGEVQSITEVAA